MLHGLDCDSGVAWHLLRGTIHYIKDPGVVADRTMESQKIKKDTSRNFNPVETVTLHCMRVVSALFCNEISASLVRSWDFEMSSTYKKGIGEKKNTLVLKDLRTQ